MPGSAPNINSIVLVGQLTADPALKQTPEGRSVCELRMAVNDRRDQLPMFIDVATFGAGADACAQHLAKGRQVAVTGRLILEQWTAKDGSKRSKHQVLGPVSFGGRDSIGGQGGDRDRGDE
jgi:single-strand DNA-binding protein